MNISLLKLMMVGLIQWMVRTAPLPPDSSFHPARLLTLIPSETIVQHNGIRMNLDMTGSNDYNLFKELKRGRQNSPINRVVTFMQTRVESGTVIDMGAHSGYHAVAAGVALGQYGTVIAMEPVHQHFSRLVHNVKLNRLSNTICLNAAISDKTGVTPMILEEQEGNSGTSRISEESGTSSNPIYAKSISLTTLMSDLSIKEIEFIKMDIQGAEWLVLPTIEHELRTGVIKMMYVELHIPQIERMNGDHSRLLELLFDSGEISQFSAESSELERQGNPADLAISSNRDEYHLIWATGQSR